MNNKNRTTEFNHPGFEEFKCGSWIADKDGIKKITEVGEFTNVIDVTPQPIFIKEVFPDYENGNTKVTLAYKDLYEKRHEEWQEITVPRQVIATRGRIIALSGYGVMVNSINARYLVEYLSEFEYLNGERLVIPW